MKIKNILLAVSIIGFAIGFSDLQENILFWMGRPVGAIFGIAYFIIFLLEKPFAEYDRENSKGAAAAKKTADSRAAVPALTTTV